MSEVGAAFFFKSLQLVRVHHGNKQPHHFLGVDRFAVQFLQGTVDPDDRFQSTADLAAAFDTDLAAAAPA